MNLHNPVAIRSYDSSGMRPGTSDTVLADDIDNTYISEDITLDKVHNRNATTNAGATLVWNLSLAAFGGRVIIHCDVGSRIGVTK